MKCFSNIKQRTIRKTNRYLSTQLFQRKKILQNTKPIITFTFDDFPKSALHIAGPILREYGAHGTYFASFGLMGTIAPTGEIFNETDIQFLVEQGHDIGCHTFHHHHAYNTTSKAFEASILQNRSKLSEIIPGARFSSLSYPISFPRPTTKAICSKHFSGCRSGGQSINEQRVDLNKINSFFIEQHLHMPNEMLDLIEYNETRNGWLIFSTHDVCKQPTRYGCKPDVFEMLVNKANESTAEILTMAEGLQAIGATHVHLQAP